MGELAKVHPIDGHLVRARLRQHNDLERSTDVDRTAAVALLAAPGAGLLVVAHDGVLPGAHGQMQIDVGAGPQAGTGLQIDGETVRRECTEKKTRVGAGE